MVPLRHHARHWGAHIAAGIAVALLIGGVAAGEARPNQGTPPQQASAANDGNADARNAAAGINPNASAKHIGGDQVETDQKWPSPGEVGLIAVGLIQAGVLAWQIWYLRNTLDHGRKSSQLELRAYVFVTDAKFSWSKARREWGAEFQYRNYGATPAYDVVVRSGLRLREAGGPEPNWGYDNTWPIGVVGPHGDKFWDEAYFDNPVPGYPQLRAALRNGTLEVFLFGRIDYVDEFDRPRWTEFRYSVGGELGYEDFHMSACREGNRTEKSA
jgi:hypothetical protein